MTQGLRSVFGVAAPEEIVQHAAVNLVPERVERIVLTGCVPFLPGFRWHRVARAWRTGSGMPWSR